MEAEESNRPLIVGERTNVIGSRLFKNLIAEEKWEEASEIARWQVKNGAHIVDVCLQSDRSRRDEGHPAVLREADPQDQGAGDDRHHRSAGGGTGADLLPGQEHHQFDQPGGRRREIRARLPASRKRYGAALVVGTIDEDKLQAQAFTRERKLAVAQRSVRAADRKIRHRAGRHHHRSAGVSRAPPATRTTSAARWRPSRRIRLIKEKIPYVKTVLGVSNISFGLPAAAREVVNSVFLYYCTKAGLDLAIVNAEKLERFASIPEEERRLAENLLFNTPAVDADDEIAAHRAGGLARADARAEDRDQPVPHRRDHRAFPQDRRKREEDSAPKTCRSIERLANYIIEGTKDGLIADLDRSARKAPRRSTSSTAR